MNPGTLHAAIFLTSGVAIAYQILLMRIFAIAQWHHFAYMMISIAMLGFAAGGTVLKFLKKVIEGRELGALRISAGFLTVTLVLSYGLSQAIPFETYQLTTQRRQLLYLFMLYWILPVPFFFASCSILLGFFLNPAHIGRVYGFNMVGSGAGALTVVGLMYFFRPEAIVYFLVLPAAVAFLLLIAGARGRVWMGAAAFLAAFCLALLFLGIVPIRISEYKGLSYAMRMPDSKIVAETQSPLSVITAVSSPLIRETPGQISYGYDWKRHGKLPEQIALFFDADSISVINRFRGSLDSVAYLDDVTAALPYHLAKPSNVLIIGSGGGTYVLMALAKQVQDITAVEVDPRILPFVREHFNEFSGSLYERSNVKGIVAEGRQFLESHEGFFDLIHIPPMDSFNASSAGVYALHESYLYTKEAFALYLRRLSPQGILSVTRWIKTPARDELKLFATLAEAAEMTGIKNPGQHLAFIRSWNTATLLISRSPLRADQIRSLRDFSSTRFFDIGYYPGVKEEETNRYTLLDPSVYYEAATKLLSGDREKFYRDYLFDIRPPSDDRPYFFNFFKWSSFPSLIKGMKTDWIPYVEWGYIALIATIAQAIFASLFLILLPLGLAFFSAAGGSHRAKPPPGGTFSSGIKVWIFFLFAGLGFGYMFLEIVFIQKFMLFLAYPIYAVAVVLTAFLVFSGIGSYFGDQTKGSRALSAVKACVLIGVFSIAYLKLLPEIFTHGGRWPDGLKITASLILLAPLAFCMGIPFPAGLQILSDHRREDEPWAWAINGCASVLGASFATLIAIHHGFPAVVYSALVMYALAAVAVDRLEKLLSERAE